MTSEIKKLEFYIAFQKRQKGKNFYHHQNIENAEKRLKELKTNY